MLFVLAAVGVGFYLVFIKDDGPGAKGRETGWGFGPKVGDVAPDFSFPTPNGHSVRLSDLRGKVVFLNIWTTWCPPCRDEMPSMQSLYQKFKKREFAILAVSIDPNGEDVVPPFVARYGLTFPVLLDPDNQISRLYSVTGIPETFIIDKKGVIALKVIGAQNWTTKKWLDYFDRVTGETS